jgi:pilus assembly protein CpaB
VTEEEEAVPYAPPEGEEIIVAAQDIPRGTLITPDGGAVMTATWPKDAVTSELAITDASQAHGRIARVDIVRGSPILDKMLTERAGELGARGSDVALQIPAGKVAYSLPVARYSAVAWALRPGDRVDAIISLLLVDLDEEYQTLLPNDTVCVSPTEEDGCVGGPMGRLETLPNGWIVKTIPGGEQRPRLVTNLTVQDAQVLRVGDWPQQDRGASQAASAEPEEGEQATPAPSEVAAQLPEVRPLTLAVTPQDAMTLKYAQEIGANIDLVLRSAEDADKSFDTESVTLEYLFERFQIEQPPKLPYGVTPPLDALEPGSAGGREGDAGGAAGGEPRE